MSKAYFALLKQQKRTSRKGRAGRHPLPGVALANNTYDGFGKGCFLPVPDEDTEDEVMRDFFPDEEKEKEEEK